MGKEDEKEEVNSYRMAFRKNEDMEFERGRTVRQSPRNFP